jgi:hydroxymethylpyrimidine/phosphomethylpyrimidine kinase
LTIAGSDCSGGAGIQADLKTFAALGVYGTSAITCIVAENPARVARVTPLAPKVVAEQIELVLEAFPVRAIKTGMLYTAEIMEAVARSLAPALKKGVPLVVDPVLAASAGGILMRKEAFGALTRFMARATLVTPNRDELARLTGRSIVNLSDLEQAARELAARLGGVAVLAKGGHLPGAQAVDLLIFPDGRRRTFRTPRLRGIDPHGTGCTYASAIAAALAQGLPPPAAVGLAKRFITRALRRRLQIGRSAVLNHFPHIP